MAVELYPHNQTAYRNAIDLMEKCGRAAVVHPTGTGKSFIAFKLAEEHPGARIIWLAPSEYIFRSQRENYLEAGGEEAALSGITFLTYAKLMYGMVGRGDEEMSEVSISSKNSKASEDFMSSQNDEDKKNIAASDDSGLQLPENAAYIVLDEFHRCGAESWGKGVELLMEDRPRAKVLGLSATHIRYLDSRRDMAGEIFGGQIASKMELAQAMAEGILPAPLYICGLYEYQDELKKVSRRVARQRCAGIRDKSVGLLEKLRRCLEQADGPREIFARHMKKDGKYIVFCSGRAHMEEMIALAGKWYDALDREPVIYRAIYDNRESAEEVRRFSADRSGHLKLLFCIDMLNEGIHVADVDGVVLLRPTASPTLYLQQVGRALSVPGKGKYKLNQDRKALGRGQETLGKGEELPDKGVGGQPVIFDMVDNFDSLRCIDSFLEEYHRISGRKAEKKKKPSYEFRVIDEARDSRRLFDQLCRSLASSWDACFEKAEVYYAEHGDLNVPKRYITEDGIALGSWLLTQRRVRAGAVPGNLSSEQIEKLDSIGMSWESRVGKAWETGYRELLDFYKENGHVDVPARYVTEGGYPLGKFVSNQRAAWKNSVRARKTDDGRNAGDAGRAEGSKFHVGRDGTAQPIGRILTAEQERKLNAVGFIWEKSEQNWSRYYAAAKAYFEKEGNLNVPVKFVTEDGLRLGDWIQAKSADRKSLPEEKAKALEEIGMVWGSRYDSKWDEKYHLAEQYYREHGNLEVPKEYKVGGVMLGRWVSALRSARERPEKSHYRLNAERIRQLDKIGMRWGGESWEARYRLAARYYQEHGDLRVSQAYVAETDGARIWLGKWLAEQRRKHNRPEKEKHALTEEQERKLEAIGMEW